MKPRVLLTIIMIFTLFQVNAQFYNYGQDHSKIKWEQLKEQEYRLIYPKNYSEYAKEVHRYLEWLYSNKSSINITPKGMAVVLHSEGGISNGMVAWAPRVANLYTLPQQTPHDYWLFHLTAHEYRHTEQMAKVNRHFTKGLYYIFGDIAPVVAIGAYIPTWYLEGDAVTFETSVGNIGRGRDPEFLNLLKAQLIEKGPYTYNKATLGSYTDYVPNHYVLGYHLCAMGRIKYGNDLWSNALTRVAKRPYGITPFNTALKRGTNNRHNRKTLYEEIITELLSEWQQEPPATYAEGEIIKTNNRYYTNYYSPIQIGCDSLIAYKSGYEESGAIVLITKGQEQTLTKTAIIYDPKIAWHNGTILWAEYHPHPRYSHSGRQQLCSYNIESGTYRYHKSQNNRYAPFSTDYGWGCVEILPNGNSDIVLLNHNMEETTRIKGKYGELYIHPSSQGEYIYAIQNTIEGNSILKFNIDEMRGEAITQPYKYMIDYPQLIGDTLYYVASFNTNNAIYRSIKGKTELIVSTRYGVTMPNINEEKIIASAYSADGYKPIEVPMNKISGSPVSFKRFTIADSISKLEKYAPLASHKADSTSHNTPKRYRRGAHLISLHSWGPLYIRADEMDVKIGASIYSQNRLNTMTLSAGYLKQEGYNSGVWHINGVYRGWWPIIGIRGEFGRQEIRATDGFSFYTFNPRYNKVSASIQLPVNLNKKDWSGGVVPYLSYNLEGYSSDKIYPEMPILQQKITFSARNIQYIDGGISLSANKFKTNLYIEPKFGLNFRFGGAKEIGEEKNIGDVIYTHLQVKLPGIFKYHSVTLYGATQQASNNSSSGYSPQILRPRGITLKGADYNTFRGTYTLPICYPDRGIGSIIYFKRIYGSLFCDYGTISLLGKSVEITSAGAELRGDINILRLTYPLNIGVRGGYETLTKSPFAELLFSISLSI